MKVFSDKRKLTLEWRIGSVWTCDHNWKRSIESSGLYPPLLTETFLQNIVNFTQKASKNGRTFEDCVLEFKKQIKARKAYRYTKKYNYLLAGNIETAMESLFPQAVSLNK